MEWFVSQVSIDTEQEFRVQIPLKVEKASWQYHEIGSNEDITFIGFKFSMGFVCDGSLRFLSFLPFFHVCEPFSFKINAVKTLRKDLA